MILIEILYLFTVGMLAIYGLNALALALFHQPKTVSDPIDSPQAGFVWPRVTIQLPVFNERYVVERLIHAVGHLDYPMDQLQVQVLDDSTDETAKILDRAILPLRERGLDVQIVHRSNRKGFKGGALQNGLQTALGEFIAIFDADFIPPPDFLKRTIPHFSKSSWLGCLQARWGHANAQTSWLTRAQSVGIDGHFLVEQRTRSQNALFLNFNGTAGIWRRSCIQDAGGWQCDTLTEDLDLSYRAQMRGWTIVYMPDLVVPAELPAHINAFKRQQFRWAKGSIQTARKLLGDLWRSSSSPLVKLEGSLHLTNYFVHPLILLNLLLTLPILFSGSRLLKIVPYFTLAAVGPPLMYWLAMREQGMDLEARFRHLFMLVILGMGVSINNARAVGEALVGVRSSFLRTPKLNLSNSDLTPENPAPGYLIATDASQWLELLLAVYALGLLIYVFKTGAWVLALWLLIYAVSFGYVAGLGWAQSKKVG